MQTVKQEKKKRISRLPEKKYLSNIATKKSNDFIQKPIYNFLYHVMALKPKDLIILYHDLSLIALYKDLLVIYSSVKKKKC